MTTNDRLREKRPITPQVDAWIETDHKFFKCTSTRDPHAEPLWQTITIGAIIAGLTLAMLLFI